MTKCIHESASLLPFSTLFHHQQGLPFLMESISSSFELLATTTTLPTNSSSNSTVVPMGQFVGEVSIAALQWISFIVLLPFVLILLTCFTRESAATTNTTNHPHDVKSQPHDHFDTKQSQLHHKHDDLLRKSHHQRVAQQRHQFPTSSTTTTSGGDDSLSTTTLSECEGKSVVSPTPTSPNTSTPFVHPSSSMWSPPTRRRKVSKNRVILFSLMLPSVIILVLLFGVRILTMTAFPVDTFLVELKPLHVRVLNGLVFCGWALNDLMLVVQFLFISYMFLQTSRKLKYISQRVYKLLVISMVVTPVILSTSVLGYITAVMTDQVTKPQQADGTAANVRPALLFFYSISTIIFIGSVIVALSYVIWTTVQLVKHLKAASMGAGLQLQQTTRTAIRKVITIVTLVSVIAAFMCLMELIALIGELSNSSVYFAVISLIGKALATWIYIAGLCLLFGPLSSLRKYVKDIFKNANEKMIMDSNVMTMQPNSAVGVNAFKDNNSEQRQNSPIVLDQIDTTTIVDSQRGDGRHDGETLRSDTTQSIVLQNSNEDQKPLGGLTVSTQE